MGTRSLLAIAAVASAAMGLPAAAHTMAGVRIGVPLYVTPPPVFVYEQVQVAPVWTPGHWEWQGDGHVWVPGYFANPQRRRPACVAIDAPTCSPPSREPGRSPAT
jgi:hypothetical protein